jgi:hypothetical protein
VKQREYPPRSSTRQLLIHIVHVDIDGVAVLRRNGGGDGGLLDCGAHCVDGADRVVTV